MKKHLDSNYMGQFIKRLAELVERENNLIKNAKKLNILQMSVNIKYDDIMPSTINKKDKVDLAEIIYTAEKRIVHMENLFTIIKRIDLNMVKNQNKGR